MQMETIFTYFSLIDVCSPYEFVNENSMRILMLGALKTVKSVKFIEIKSPREARPPGI